MRVKPTDPVYPVASDVPLDFNGMNHRTYIAAQIMAGIASSHLGVKAIEEEETAGLADLAVQWADALIAELNKTK